MAGGGLIWLWQDGAAELAAIVRLVTTEQPTILSCHESPSVSAAAATPALTSGEAAEIKTTAAPTFRASKTVKILRAKR